MCPDVKRGFFYRVKIGQKNENERILVKKGRYL